MIPNNIGDFGKNLSNDEARMKLLGAEMTLANIRALCDGSLSLGHSSALRGIISAIHQVANRVMDEEVRAACDTFGKIQCIKEEFRDLAERLNDVAGPAPKEEEDGPEEVPEATP